MNAIQCIFCKSGNVILTDSIDTDQLIKLYQKRAGVDVKRFFDQESISICSCKDCGLKFFWPVISGDGKFYDDLQDYPGYFLKDKTEYREAAKYITINDEVLEIGCGEGLFADFISSRSYLGLEFSDKAIEKANLKKLNVVKQSIEEHANFAKEKYDVVCSFQVLEHVNDPGEFIKHGLCCLKPGGKLIIAVPSEDSFIRDAVNFYLNMPPHHVSRWSDETLKKNAGIFNLKINDTIHEPLHAIHKKFYLKTIIFKKLTEIFGIRRKYVDPGFACTMIYIAATTAAFIASPFLNDPEKINGQSVLVVYSKK